MMFCAIKQHSLYIGLGGPAFQQLIGYIFMPFAWMLGVEESECQDAGELLALKMLVNEYVAYAKLAEKIEVS